jgi:hypothetical protein
VYVCAELCLLVCVTVACRVKELIPEEEPNVLNDPTPDGEHLSEDEGKSHRTFDHIAPICMVVSSRVWLG